MKSALMSAIVALVFASPSAAQIIVSEVHPNGSGGGAAYGADWFELTNTGGSIVDITGWRVDDSSYSFASSAPLAGVTSILPGQSVVFMEGDGTNNGVFSSSWFGASPPPGFVMGNYMGSGIGLSTGGDAVQIYDSAGNIITGVSFGSTALELRTLDNAAGTGSTATPAPVISIFSAAGVNGAFNSFALVGGAPEVGSPGVVPEPSSLTLAGLGALVALRNRKKLKGFISR